ncbi:hypothetical protein Tco_0155709 [Tanacetum coccineum]
MHLSSHSAGPSRKRCRSPVDSAPLSMPVTGSLAPTRADLSPPRKRFRDSYSSEASIEEDAEVGLTGTGVDMELEEYEADASTGDMAEVGIDPMTAPLVDALALARGAAASLTGEDSPDTPGTGDGIVRSVEDTPVLEYEDWTGAVADINEDGFCVLSKHPNVTIPLLPDFGGVTTPVDLGNVVRDFYHHMSEVRVDRIVEIETAQRRLEADQFELVGRARMAEMLYS